MGLKYFKIFKKRRELSLREKKASYKNLEIKKETENQETGCDKILADKKECLLKIGVKEVNING